KRDWSSDVCSSDLASNSLTDRPSACEPLPCSSVGCCAAGCSDASDDSAAGSFPSSGSGPGCWGSAVPSSPVVVLCPGGSALADCGTCWAGGCRCQVARCDWSVLGCGRPVGC